MKRLEVLISTLSTQSFQDFCNTLPIDKGNTQKSLRYIAATIWNQKPLIGFEDNDTVLLNNKRRALYKLLTNYIVKRDLCKVDNEDLKSILLDRYLRKNEKHNLANQLINKSLNTSELKSPYEAQIKLWRLATLNESYLMSGSRDEFRLEKEYLHSIKDAYDIANLEIGCTRMSIYNISNQNNSLHNNINISLNKSPTQLVKAFYLAFNMLKERNEQSFNELLVTLVNNKTVFSPSTMFRLFTYAQNFAIRLSASNERDGLSKVMKLYKSWHSTGNLFDKTTFNAPLLKNLTVAACYTNHIEWAERILEKNKILISSTLSESQLHLNLAIMAFHKGDYDSTLQLLSITKFNDDFFNLGVAQYTLQVYYETQEANLFLDLAKAMVNRINNLNVSPEKKQSWKNYIYMIRKLNALRKLNPITKIASNKYKNLEAFLTSNPVVGKKWLKDKLLELSPNK